MIALANEDFWSLYLQAVAEALLLPDINSFLAAARAEPLLLFTQTWSVPPVATPRALAQVLRFGNTLPLWSRLYEPRADGDLLGLYRSFTASIKRQNDPLVIHAAELLQQLDRQLAAGAGELVMKTQTDAGEANSPRYDPSPLGSPGFSGWLDLAIWTYGKLPPQIDLTIDAQSSARVEPGTSFGTLRGARLPEFLSVNGIDKSAITSLRLIIPSLTTVSLTPGAWYVASLLRCFVEPGDFRPGTIFNQRPIWGPDGILGLIPIDLVAAFRPVVEAAFDAGPSEAGAVRALRFGPFRLVPDDDQSGLRVNERRFVDPALDPVLLGVACDTPNWRPASALSRSPRTSLRRLAG